jgi:hypothetical protein
MDDLSSVLQKYVLLADTSNYETTIQGISPPLDSSILWLYLNMASSDNFLYIIVSSSL